MSQQVKISAILLTLLFMSIPFLSACRPSGDSLPTPTITISLEQTSPPSSATPFQPSPTVTPIPLAASVNGDAISLAELEAELLRYKNAHQEMGQEIPEDAETLVLEDLVNQLLFAQAAAESGFTLQEDELQSRLGGLSVQAGGTEAFSNWLTDNGYTQETFTQALSRALASTWMRDRILESIPQSVEQVHARQILLSTPEEAQRVLSQLRSGVDFATFSSTYDPVTLGELGWFPRGYLLEPSLEQAAFELEPGEISEVIETRLGYHILQVIERDAERSLSPDAAIVVQNKALAEWLENQRSQSEIQLFVP